MKWAGRESDVRRWVTEGKTDGWIARKLGTTAQSVATFRWRRAIRRRPPRTPQEFEEEDVRTLVSAGRTDEEIAAALDASPTAVRAFRWRRGIRRSRTRELCRREGEIRTWVGGGRSDRWIAERVNSSEASIRGYRLRRGIKRVPPDKFLETLLAVRTLGESADIAAVAAEVGAAYSPARVRLERLLEKGLLLERTTRTLGRRRRVYALTPAGKAALRSAGPDGDRT